MTEIEKKAEEYANHLQAEMFAYCPPRGRRTPTLLDIQEAYIAGATENSFVWHNLRKNPEDLPEERHDVLCFVIHNEHRYYLQGYYNGGTWRCTPLGTYLNDEDVKAWCEIHTFKE